ncbi:hypothetical protein PMAYCL1PPCAC_13884, partial [Pristionchus mayeri]
VNSPGLPFECMLLNVLQGQELEWEERQELANIVAALPTHNRNKLIDFIEKERGAAESAVEGNACQSFQCSTSQFGEIISSEEGVDQLCEHFHTLISELIPTLESILYPLQSSHDHFSIRRTLLRSFRDQVLLRILESASSRIPRLEHLVFTVLFESFDNSLKYYRFERLANIILGREH